MKIKTITTATGVNLVDFGDNAPRFYWLRNLGDSTLYVSAKPNPTAGGEDVSELPPKSSTSIETDTGKIYILGAGKVEIHNTDSKFCPFKGVIVVSGGGGGGETTGYISDGLICFSELTDEIVYNPTADGKIGRNVNNCDGTNGYVSAKRTGIVGQMSSAFTIQALCRTTVSSSTIKFIFGVMYDVSFNTAMLMVKDGCFGLERSNGQIMSTVMINDDDWHLLTAAYDGTTMRLYVDGVNVADYTGTWAIPEDATIRVGNWNGSINDFCFAGNIANACIYNRALSDDEVMQNWQTDVRRYGISN